MAVEFKPTPEQVTVMLSLLVAVRPEGEHEGFAVIPWVRKFHPKTADDVRALLGLAQMLADPELSPTDLQNIAKDVLREPKLRKFFGF